MIYEMQVDLQAVKTSIDTQTGSLQDDITVTKEDLKEAIAKTRNNIQEALSLMFLVEAQTMKR
jgi:predicted amino acid-binding ACT domain protein